MRDTLRGKKCTVLPWPPVDVFSPDFWIFLEINLFLASYKKTASVAQINKSIIEFECKPWNKAVFNKHLRIIVLFYTSEYSQGYTINMYTLIRNYTSTQVCRLIFIRGYRYWTSYLHNWSITASSHGCVIDQLWRYDMSGWNHIPRSREFTEQICAQIIFSWNTRFFFISTALISTARLRFVYIFLKKLSYKLSHISLMGRVGWKLGQIRIKVKPSLQKMCWCLQKKRSLYFD